jgi:hypothetical protein
MSPIKALPQTSLRAKADLMQRAQDVEMAAPIFQKTAIYQSDSFEI